MSGRPGPARNDPATGGSGRVGLDHLDAQVADPVTQQLLEVLIAGSLSEGGAHEQVLDPGAAEVEGEEGMQLVPRPRRAGLPVNVTEHGEEARELAEQGDTGVG